jgi:hypothetical protein
VQRRKHTPSHLWKPYCRNGLDCNSKHDVAPITNTTQRPSRMVCGGSQQPTCTISGRLPNTMNRTESPASEGKTPTSSKASPKTRRYVVSRAAWFPQNHCRCQILWRLEATALHELAWRVACQSMVLRGRRVLRSIHTSQRHRYCPAMAVKVKENSATTAHPAFRNEFDVRTLACLTVRIKVAIRAAVAGCGHRRVNSSDVTTKSSDVGTFDPLQPYHRPA